MGIRAVKNLLQKLCLRQQAHPGPTQKIVDWLNENRT